MIFIVVQARRRCKCLHQARRCSGSRSSQSRNASCSALSASVSCSAALLVGVHRADSAARRNQRLSYVEAILAGFPILPVDTNVARVLARRFPEGWTGAPPGREWAAGQALMDLGRIHCTARAPRCEAGCPVRSGCPAAESGDVHAADPPRRRQGPYAGSMRQRRGRLLGELAAGRGVSMRTDPEAAESLLRDGLASRGGDLLVRASR